MNLDRRLALLAALAAALLGACASGPPRGDASAYPPIVFVHGNGDTAGLWITTLWRFESNGWPRERLHAVNLPYPLARDEDDKPQEGRTSAVEYRDFLAAEVARVRAATHADKVVLMANSRGATAVRYYIATGGGAKVVSHAILGGGTNHGVWANKSFRPTSEFNGAGPLLTALNNQGGPGIEVTPGVKWLTIRSDRNDKYAQPDGAWIGAKGTPTHVSYDGPALAGATNVVLPGVDHRETAFGPAAFAAAYEFITGKKPATTSIVPEPHPVLDGVVSGLGYENKRGNYANNLPLVGATVEVWRTDPATGARIGPAVHRKTIGADGRWGPFAADNSATYEFVIAAPGYATTHIYRSPFPRSSSIVNMHPEHIADADKGAKAIVTFTRPRGYFGLPEDRIAFDGAPPAGVVPGVAGVSSAKVKPGDATERTIVGEFNGERIAGRTWPAADNQTSILELTY